MLGVAIGAPRKVASSGLCSAVPWYHGGRPKLSISPCKYNGIPQVKGRYWVKLSTMSEFWTGMGISWCNTIFHGMAALWPISQVPYYLDMGLVMFWEGAAVTKYCWQSNLSNVSLLCHNARGPKYKIKVVAAQFLSRPLSLVCRWPPSHRDLTWSSLCSCVSQCHCSHPPLKPYWRGPLRYFPCCCAQIPEKKQLWRVRFVLAWSLRVQSVTQG